MTDSQMYERSAAATEAAASKQNSRKVSCHQNCKMKTLDQLRRFTSLSIEPVVTSINEKSENKARAAETSIMSTMPADALFESDIYPRTNPELPVQIGFCCHTR
jgi:hypothetical protein